MSALMGADLLDLADLPGVGANLQDHLEVYVQFASKQPVSVNPHIGWLRKLGVASRVQVAVIAVDYFVTQVLILLMY